MAIRSLFSGMIWFTLLLHSSLQAFSFAAASCWLSVRRFSFPLWSVPPFQSKTHWLTVFSGVLQQLLLRERRVFKALHCFMVKDWLTTSYQPEIIDQSFPLRGPLVLFYLKIMKIISTKIIEWRASRKNPVWNKPLSLTRGSFRREPFAVRKMKETIFFPFFSLTSSGMFCHANT